MDTAMPNGRQLAARILTVVAADSKTTEARRAETGYSSSPGRSRAKPSRYASRAAGPSPARFTRSTSSVTSRSSSVWVSACTSRLLRAERLHHVHARGTRGRQERRKGGGAHEHGCRGEHRQDGR